MLASSFSSLSFMSWRDVASRWALRYLQADTKAEEVEERVAEDEREEKGGGGESGGG